ncbi:response regulator [Bradyrhizobium japonicum]|uniref:response regulator n=1 Tax=Bradyrhizobium japonicum TaxID=375 RepID=UPI003514A36E
MHDPLVLILVVEDDVPIQEAVRSALMEGGFEADLSSSGEETVALLEAQTGNYRALITDINLQGRFTGWDVQASQGTQCGNSRRLHERGRADQWHSHGVPNSLILQKPFAPAQVVTAVSQLLNQISPIQRE